MHTPTRTHAHTNLKKIKLNKIFLKMQNIAEYIRYVGLFEMHVIYTCLKILILILLRFEMYVYLL